VALGVAGRVLVRKKFTRKQLLAYTANMQVSPIGLEAPGTRSKGARSNGAGEILDRRYGPHRAFPRGNPGMLTSFPV
jgi:hypothetical protein